MRINKPQLFNGQYLASNDAILVKLFGPNGFTSGAQVFSPAEGATLLSSLIPWSEADIPASALLDRIYGSTIAVSTDDARSIITYVNDKIAAATDDVITGQLPKLAADISDEVSARIDADSKLQKQLDKIGLAKNADAADGYAATYTFTNAAGTTTEINIPKDQFLKAAEYVPSAEVLRFTFELSENGSDEDKVVDIPVGSLVDEYSAGAGIDIVDSVSGTNVISAVVDPNSEGFLTVGAAGLKLAGVQTAIDTASGFALAEANAYAKGYADVISAAVSGAAAAQFTDINNFIPVASGYALAEAKAYADALSAAVSGAAAVQFADEAAARKADDEYISGVIDYVSGKVSGVAGYDIFAGEISALTLDDADKLAKVGAVKTYVDAEVSKAVAGDVAGLLENKVDKSQIANTVSVASGLPTNEAVISYVTDYVGSHNGVYEAPAAWADPTDTTLTGLYVSAEGETKFWNGTEYIATSEEVAESFTDAISSAIPTVDAVKEYVSGQVDSVKTYVEGEVAATVAAVNTKAVEMLETNVIFGTNDSAEISGTVPGRVIAVYGADEEQCYPSIQYKEGITTIYADALSAVYTVVYAKRIGQDNGVLPAYPTATE